MGMPAPPNERPPIPTLPAGELWTADRVRAELIDEGRPSPRYEFIDGELLVSPSPAYVHQAALRELFRILDPYVVAHGLGETLWSPSDVELAPNNTAQPIGAWRWMYRPLRRRSGRNSSSLSSPARKRRVWSRNCATRSSTMRWSIGS
jgi:hypothetical protein